MLNVCEWYVPAMPYQGVALMVIHLKKRLTMLERANIIRTSAFGSMFSAQEKRYTIKTETSNIHRSSILFSKNPKNLLMISCCKMLVLWTTWKCETQVQNHCSCYSNKSDWFCLVMFSAPMVQRQTQKQPQASNILQLAFSSSLEINFQNYLANNSFISSFFTFGSNLLIQLRFSVVPKGTSLLETNVRVICPRNASSKNFTSDGK